MMLSAPNRLIAELQDKVPGLQASLHHDGLLRLIYRCPCGELSMMRLEIAHVPPAVTFEFVLESLRNHVRSEGNTPVF